ncbi:unnamed protein product [Leptosia nina]|uniref:RNA-binding region-containing protein 3 n=1 Tax=Leptosia nina TaxID=320188 RepID=A0AAV1J717_9NEOP
MSAVLMIRHLPANLSFQDKEQLLKHYGAQKVWECRKKRNYIFASFFNKETAESVLRRLHQLEIAHRRLVVEFSSEKEPIKDCSKNVEESLCTLKIKEFQKLLNAWNPSIDFYQPPPVHIKYKYPSLDPKIAVNLIFSMFKHKPLYIQLLHLMNKMGLEVPFSDNSEAIQFFKDTFQELFSDKIVTSERRSESESEIESCDETEKSKQSLPSLKKRQHTLPVMRKRAAAILSTAILPKVKKSQLNQEDVFDVVTPVTETKKISLIVNHDILTRPIEEPEVIGELGKFQKEETPLVELKETPVEEQPSMTRKELLKNRISHCEMKILPIYKNYHPGQPSMRLYIKNLAKTVTEQDVKRIYKGYIETLSEEEQNGFDVRVMQEGRMKGQAFITFPSIELAKTALNETNGFLLKERPMVVQFARVANKNTID